MSEISVSTRPYHHGHLRQALIDAALELIGERGVDKLTIRSLAERVGVSHAAPQYHFADKSALLQAVAAQGFRNLFASMQGALSETDPEARLRGLGRAYVDFALAHPSEYRVMFATETLHTRQHSDEFLQVANAAFDALVSVVAGFIEEQDREHPRLKAAAFFAWSTVHGAVMLRLNNIVPTDEDELCPPGAFGASYGELIEAALGLVVQALAGWRRDLL